MDLSRVITETPTETLGYAWEALNLINTPARRNRFKKRIVKASKKLADAQLELWAVIAAIERSQK